MRERKYLESVRASIREIKWGLALTNPNITDLQGKAAWCADYISELLDGIDSDLLTVQEVESVLRRAQDGEFDDSLPPDPGALCAKPEDNIER